MMMVTAFYFFMNKKKGGWKWKNEKREKKTQKYIKILKIKIFIFKNWFKFFFKIKCIFWVFFSCI